MKILFLGGNFSKKLVDWLVSNGEDVVYIEDKFSLNQINAIHPDYIVSYNYQHIISKKILDSIDVPAINLHISYLPWNRGTQPNVWSFLEDSPKGVTIHYMDEGIDTGDIIIQKEVSIDPNKETLSSSYLLLQDEIQKLFKENWYLIKDGKITRKKQCKNCGSVHSLKDMVRFMPIIDKTGWDILVVDFLKKYSDLSE